MKRDDLVLVPFPFDDLSSAKLRPALRLSAPRTVHGHVVLAFISSRVPAPDEIEETDLILEPHESWFPRTGSKSVRWRSCTGSLR